MPIEHAQFTGTERFSILRRIGAGGMGVVYEAYDQERHERVALKTLPQVDAGALYHLKQEFRSLTDFVHPNLAELHELFSTGEQCFFTMELVEGVNFLEYVRLRLGLAAAGEGTVESVPSTRSLSAETSVRSGQVVYSSPTAEFGRLRRALRDLVHGVCALHRAGKLHRDIKPSNVLVTPQGRVVLLDFGLVTELEKQPLSQQDESSFAGTIAYMAPEQAAGLPLSAASDWYCVGVMLYEALAGRRPFVGDRDQVLRDKQRREPCSPAELVLGIPEDLNALCVDLLRRRPEDRTSGAEILRRLGMEPHEPETLPGQRPSRQRGAPFVGRERHLAVLTEAYLAIKQGQPVTVHVHGRSGVGKTLLLQRFLEDLVRREKLVVLAGRCYERESVPYKALDSLVDALSRYLARLPDDEVADLIPPDVQALARVFPVLRRVGAVAEAPSLVFDIPDQQELRRRAFAALRELLGRLGDRGPLVLHIDDLQWGDVDSAALLADLWRAPDPPVLLLLTSYRSEYADTSPCLRALLEARKTAAETVDQRELAVEPLSLAEGRSLALELLGQDSPTTHPLAETIAEESEGNPYFVHELVQYVQEGAALPERWSAKQKITLDEVLQERLARLPEASQRLLEVVSVAGGPLRQADAYRAATVGPEGRNALAVLRAGRLVMSTGPGDQDEVETYHDRIRETVAAHLSGSALKAHHRCLAVTLEASSHADPETLAVHFLGADDPGKAGHYYAAAAKEAADALAFDRAAKLYRLSLELRPVEGADGRSLRTKLADALANAGRGAEASREYVAATAGAGAAEALELQRRAAMQSLISGHIDDGLAALRKVLQAVGMKLAATPRRALFSLLLRRAQLWLRGVSFRERDAAEIPPEELSRIDICWSVAMGLSIVDTIRAADFQTRNLLLALRAGEPYRIARGLAWEAAHVANGGGPASQRTAKLLLAAEELARRINHPHALGLTTLTAGIAGYMEGRWKAAKEHSEHAETIFRERCTGVAWELDTAHSFALWSLFFLGEVAELIRRLPLLLKEARERGDLYAATNLGTFVGYLTWLAVDDPEGARRDLREVMGRWSHQGFHVQHLTGLMAELQIDLYSGDGMAAWRRITEQWTALAGSLFLRVQVVRIFMLHLRARSALAAALGAANPEPLWRAAERDALKIEREKMPWSAPLAQLISAALAAGRGDNSTAIALLNRAAKSLDAADMGLFAAAARRRQGELLGGERGRQLIAQADGWMTSQKIANPSRMAGLHAPGFGNRT